MLQKLMLKHQIINYKSILYRFYISAIRLIKYISQECNIGFKKKPELLLRCVIQCCIIVYYK